MSIRDFIPLARPDINEEDIARVAEVLRTGMLVQGKNVLSLEKAFAELHQSPNAVAASNGTATLHLALKALGVGKGDEVIVPAFSYTATANVVELVEATPVFVDIDINTFNIDVNKIERAITSKTKAIIPVHEFGLACDIEEVCNIAENHRLHVIEDAACALGARQHNRLIGSFGIFGSFSLHPRKSITAGEGGMLLTPDKELNNKIRQLRNHGLDPDNSEMDFLIAGFNYRMTDFQAALALSQFQRLEKILQQKNKLAEIYFNEIKNNHIKMPVIPEGHNHTWQTFHLLLDDSLDQKEVIKKLKDLNIGSNYGAQCIPAQTYYKRKYGYDSQEQFPEAYRAYRKGLAIPIYERLSEEDIVSISKIINEL